MPRGQEQITIEIEECVARGEEVMEGNKKKETYLKEARFRIEYLLSFSLLVR